MDAARRRSIARTLLRSYRLFVMGAAVVVLGALTIHLGCHHATPGPSTADADKASHHVRVRIVSDASQVRLTASEKTRLVLAKVGALAPQSLALPAKTPIVLAVSPAGWQVGSVSLPPGDLELTADPPGTLSLEGRAYRGVYRLVPMRGSTVFDVVNRLEVDDYLKGVLAAELHAEFHPEAYKAQAVIARTYALYTARTTPASRHWDLHADVRSQMYGGIRSELPKAVQAVDATRGQVVAYGSAGNERIFKTYYSSCCGGITTSANEVFGEPAIAPFTPKSVGTRCDISAGPYKARYTWGPVVISRTELLRRLRLWGRSAGHPLKDATGIRRIEVARANAAGRPVQYAVEDARNVRHLISAEQLRVAVNTDAGDASRLSSGFVTVTADAQNFRFEGRGFGHGVGACQWCMEAQARQGIRHDAIVRDAFPGAQVVPAY
jgi:stage II sporulation protein D